MKTHSTFTSIVVIDVTGFLTDIGFPLPQPATTTQQSVETTTSPITSSVTTEKPDTVTGNQSIYILYAAILYLIVVVKSAQCTV